MTCSVPVAVVLSVAVLKCEKVQPHVRLTITAVYKRCLFFLSNLLRDTLLLFFFLIQVEKPDSTNQADIRNLTAYAEEKGNSIIYCLHVSFRS